MKDQKEIFLFGGLLLAVLMPAGLATPAYSPYRKKSLEFGALNSYLTSASSAVVDTKSVVQLLKQTIEMIKTKGIGSTTSFKPELADERLKPLLGCNTEILLLIMEKLVMASNSCEEDALNFMLRVAECETYDGQFLNIYANSLIDRCWAINLDMLEKRVTHVMGKFERNSTDYLIEVADWVKRRRDHTGKQSIAIYGSRSNDGDPQRDMAALQTMTLNSSDQMNLFVKALDFMFVRSSKKEMGEPKFDRLMSREKLELLKRHYAHSLVLPCRELEERMQSALRLLLLDRSKFSLEAIYNAMESRRSMNLDLHQQFELHRICIEVREHNDEIEKLLAKKYEIFSYQAKFYNYEDDNGDDY